MKLIYRTYDFPNNMLHWRVTGAATMAMLCGKGDYLDWDRNRWDHEKATEICQECEVQYVLEIMS